MTHELDDEGFRTVHATRHYVGQDGETERVIRATRERVAEHFRSAGISGDPTAESLAAANRYVPDDYAVQAGAPEPVYTRLTGELNQQLEKEFGGATVSPPTDDELRSGVLSGFEEACPGCREGQTSDPRAHAAWCSNVNPIKHTGEWRDPRQMSKEELVTEWLRGRSHEQMMKDLRGFLELAMTEEADHVSVAAAMRQLIDSTLLQSHPVMQTDVMRGRRMFRDDLLTPEERERLLTGKIVEISPDSLEQMEVDVLMPGEEGPLPPPIRLNPLSPGWKSEGGEAGRTVVGPDGHELRSASHPHSQRVQDIVAKRRISKVFRIWDWPRGTRNRGWGLLHDQIWFYDDPMLYSHATTTAGWESRGLKHAPGVHVHDVPTSAHEYLLMMPDGHGHLQACDPMGNLLDPNKLWRRDNGRWLRLYMVRRMLWIPRWLGNLRLRVHTFHSGDDDSAPHDHPWSFVTFPLRTYTETVEVPTGECWRMMARPAGDGTGIEFTGLGAWTRVVRRVRAFRFHWRAATHRHFVHELERPFTTVVLARETDPPRTWGFWPQPDVFVPHDQWTEYQK